MGPVPGAMGSITGDQMSTDNFEIQEIGNVVYEVDCSMKELDLHEGRFTVMVPDLVHDFFLQHTVLDMESYMRHMRGLPTLFTSKKKKKVFGLLPTIVCFSVCTWYQAMAQGPAQIS